MVVRRSLVAFVSLVAIGFLSLALAACGGGSNDSKPSVPASSPSKPTGGPIEVSEAGAAAATAFLHDGASVTAKADGDLKATITVTLPTGNTSTSTFSLTTGAALSPDKPAADPKSPIQGFTISAKETPNGLEWTYRYVVPADQLPNGALARATEDGTPRRLGETAAVLLNAKVDQAQGGPGIQVVAQGTLQEFSLEALSKIEEAMRERAGQDVEKTGTPLTQSVDSILDVVDVIQTSAKYKQQKERLDGLRQCAENPTNPLTQKQYKDDPAARQRILDDVSNVETEIKANTLVEFIGSFNSTASDITKQAWLGFIVGPLTNWANAQLGAVNDELLDNLDKEIADCGGHHAFVGTYTYPYGNHPELGIAGISCTQDLNGEWAFMATGNPAVPVTRDSLTALVAGVKSQLPAFRTAPGAGVQLIGESPFRGVLELTPDKPPKMKVTVFKGLTGTEIVDTGVFDIFDIDASTGFCAALPRHDLAP